MTHENAPACSAGAASQERLDARAGLEARVAHAVEKELNAFLTLSGERVTKLTATGSPKLVGGGYDIGVSLEFV